MESIKTEIVVLGAGPGGYAAAFYAADKGKKVLLVEMDKRLGGVCLNRGCIPSKALLHATQLITEARESEHRGITFGAPKIDLQKLRAWKESIIQKLSGGISSLAKMRNVEVLYGRGYFEDSKTLRVETSEGQKFVTYDAAIIAVGSKSAMPKAFDLGNPRIMTSREALEVPDVPGTLLIVGGGYIGMELGTVYATLGKQIKVVMETDGKKVEELYDRVLVSVGRVPNHADLGLQNTKITKDDRGFIKVNEKQQTSDPRIYAIVDVAGGVMLAHKATREGRVAVDAILGEYETLNKYIIPAVVFTDPEIAWCGLTETEAKEKGITVKVARFPWAASGRALTYDRPDGLTKLIIDPATERVLGAGITGHGAGELIGEMVLAVEMGATAYDVASSIHPHPTLSESIMEGAEVFYGQATHTFTRKTSKPDEEK